jgi:hypothetical protein
MPDPDFNSLDQSSSPETDGGSFAAQLAGGQDEEFVIADDEKKSTASRTTIAFIGLAAVAAGGLWFMRQRTVGPAEAAADPLVPTAQDSVRQFLDGGQAEIDEMEALVNDTAAIRDRFASLGLRLQVPLDQLKTNPFFVPDEEPEVDEDNEEFERERLAQESFRARQEREQAIRAAAGRLRVETVFLGKRPTCIINGTICRVGTELEGFTVTAIADAGVTVTKDGLQFTLTNGG